MNLHILFYINRNLFQEGKFAIFDGDQANRALDGFPIGTKSGITGYSGIIFKLGQFSLEHLGIGAVSIFHGLFQYINGVIILG
jgi:hypothetical protein